MSCGALLSDSSFHMEALLAGAAYSGSLRHWNTMQAREPADANRVLAWRLRRRLGMTAWHCSVRLLLDRLSYVGRGAESANLRRAAAAETAAAGRRAAH